MFKSHVLTICSPYYGCDKNCPYCVAKMTGYDDTNIELMQRNIPKVKTFAKAAGVTTILITGKGEPLLRMTEIGTFGAMNISSYFREWPLEIQTNGIKLSGDPEGIGKALYTAGVNTVAISVDSMNFLHALKPTISILNKLSIKVRITMNISECMRGTNLMAIIKICKHYGVQQLTFRQLTVPEENTNEQVAEWIHKNGAPDIYESMVKELSHLTVSGAIKARHKTNYGTPIYSYDGLSLTFSDECIQERHDKDDVRSLIFRENGHLYTLWDDEASMIF